MISLSLLLIALSFISLWLGSGMTITSLEKISTKLRASSFSVSFLLLGILTSLSETSVGINSVIDNEPQLSIGNLIGASIVILLFIIPLLAIINNGLKVEFEDSSKHLPIALAVIAAPTFLVLDKNVNFIDSVILIVSFVTLSFLIQKRNNILTLIEETVFHPNVSFYKHIFRIILGAIIIFISGKVLVDQTLVVAEALKISTFILGLLIISIGTNIPELSVLLVSVLRHKKQIALGDYIGSAAFNTFLLGIIPVLYGNPIILTSGLKPNVLFLPLGALLLYYFTQNKKLSRNNGIILLSIYIVFVLIELLL